MQEDSNYVPPTGLNSAVQALEQAFHERQAREQEALETYTGTVEKGVKHYAAQVKQGVAQEAQKITAFQKANAQEAGPSIENTESGPSKLIKSHSSNLPLVTDLARFTDPNDEHDSGWMEGF